MRFVATTWEHLRARYALVGSFASGIWGEPRFTPDIDVVVEIDSRHVDLLCAAFPPDNFDVNRAAAAEAVALLRPFHVIHPKSGNKIDFIVQGAAAWQRGQIERSVRVPLSEDGSIQVASPADVIIGKLAYCHERGSDKHPRDIAGILRVNGAMVDCSLVDAAADELAEELEVADVWRRLRHAARS
ncbi:MAG: hypothetical protein KF688_08680 [Pirellulales bacterium]|nr:hypothetical protein [Pirellulales bacterium]